MFRKIIITILVLSTLLLIIIGYPLKKNVTVSRTHLKNSERCFITGDLRQYISCLKNQKLQGIHILTIIISDINKEVSPVGNIFIFFLLLQIPLVYLIVKDFETN